MKETKEKIVQVRMTEEEFVRLKKNSQASHLTVSEYIRLALLEKNPLRKKVATMQSAIKTIGEIVDSST